ncbi:MAG: hypothetical protein ACE5K8_05485 [Candidatus Zixiibacteriota bacterium]
MQTGVGEYIVGAYLKLIKECSVVDYNVRAPGGGMKGLRGLDVVGLHFETKTAYLCEVTTHITGLLYKNNQTTVARIKQKHEFQIAYASQYLSDFPTRHYMYWSPVVPKGYITENLGRISGLELIINEEYTRCIEELRKLAKKITCDVGNPFFRTLQILEHIR